MANNKQDVRVVCDLSSIVQLDESEESSGELKNYRFVLIKKKLKESINKLLNILQALVVLLMTYAGIQVDNAWL